MAAALLLAAVPSALHSQGMVLHRFSSGQPDPQMEEILYFAAGTGLLQAGLSSTRKDGAADYVLSARYASGNGSTEVRYTFYRPPSPENVLADLTVDLPVDASLDAAVETAMHRLLAAAGIEVKPSAEARIEGLLPEASATAGTATAAAATAAAATAAAAPKPDGVTEAGANAGATAEGSTTNPAAVIVESPAHPSPRPATRLAFESSVSAAGVLLLGAITEFLHYGAGGVLRAGVSWPLKAWRPTLGAEVSFTRAFNDAGVTGGPLYLSTAGPMVQVGTGDDVPYHAAVALSGGAAMITVQTAAGLKTQTVPYADAAARLSIPMSRRLSIGADVGFLAVFASDVLILAVTPALAVRVAL